MTKQQKIQALLQKIRDKSSDKEYIYRGENKNFKEISSSLYRKHPNGSVNVIQKKMLEEARGYTLLKEEQEILTELQHYGAKTNLIDFTSDYLIALFFACDGSPKKDGRIILLDKMCNTANIWLPKNQNNRIIAQKSMFFQPPDGYLTDDKAHIIIIKKDLKKPILKYLNQYHGISTQTIYNDIHGYIRIQKLHSEAYVKFFKGLSYSENKKHQKAIECYTKAIELKPNFAEAYNNRGIGVAKADSKKYLEEAIEDYNKAIELNPNYFEAYYNRGIAKAGLKRYLEAIADYSQAIAKNPDNAEAYNNRGIAKVGLEQYNDAIADYSQAIALNPDNAEAYNNRGNAKVNSRRYKNKQAILDYDEAIELNPDYAKAYNNRGIAKVGLEQYSDAIIDYDKAIELNPDYANAYYNRGNAKAKLGKNNEAIEDNTKTIELAQQQNNPTLLKDAQKMIDKLNGKIKNN